VRCELWALDTQYVESLNSSIKHVITAAPHISLDLLSARTVLRRSLPRMDVKDVLAEAVQRAPWAAGRELVRDRCHVLLIAVGQ
jgi:hypothetical protein